MVSVQAYTDKQRAKREEERKWIFLSQKQKAKKANQQKDQKLAL
jgi:hypothetical protein